MTVYEYLVIVEQQIRQKSVSAEIIGELKQHVEDQAEAFCGEGMDPALAIERAVEEMGDPVETGIQLDQVHQPHPDVKLLMVLAGIDLAVTVLQLVVLGGEAFNAGQMIWKGTGLWMMFILALTKYNDDFRKYPLILWLVFLGVGGGVALAEERITGGGQSFALSMQAALNLSLMGFAGVTFKKRGGGPGDLAKLLAVGGTACILSLTTHSYSYTTLLVLAHVTILTVAVRRNWYRIDQRKTLRLLWILPGLLLLGSVPGIVGGILDGRYRQQIIAYGQTQDLPGLFLRSFGKGGVILLLFWVLLLCLIVLWFVRDVRRITNQFCNIMCIGILLGMGIAAVNSCLAILGYADLSEVYFPFVSAARFQNSSYIYFYYWGAGIFLHLYRNDRVIPRTKMWTRNHIL